MERFEVNVSIEGVANLSNHKKELVRFEKAEDVSIQRLREHLLQKLNKRFFFFSKCTSMKEHKLPLRPLLTLPTNANVKTKTLTLTTAIKIDKNMWVNGVCTIKRIKKIPFVFLMNNSLSGPHEDDAKSVHYMDIGLDNNLFSDTSIRTLKSVILEKLKADNSLLPGNASLHLINSSETYGCHSLNLYVRKRAIPFKVHFDEDKNVTNHIIKSEDIEHGSDERHAHKENNGSNIIVNDLVQLRENQILSDILDDSKLQTCSNGNTIIYISFEQQDPLIEILANGNWDYVNEDEEETIAKGQSHASKRKSNPTNTIARVDRIEICIESNDKSRCSIRTLSNTHVRDIKRELSRRLDFRIDGNFQLTLSGTGKKLEDGKTLDEYGLGGGRQLYHGTFLIDFRYISNSFVDLRIVHEKDERVARTDLKKLLDASATPLSSTEGEEGITRVAYDCQVLDTITVSDLKSLLHRYLLDENEVPLEEMCLCFKNQELEDNASLARQKIFDGMKTPTLFLTDKRTGRHQFAKFPSDILCYSLKFLDVNELVVFSSRLAKSITKIPLSPIKMLGEYVARMSLRKRSICLDKVNIKRFSIPFSNLPLPENFCFVPPNLSAISTNQFKSILAGKNELLQIGAISKYCRFLDGIPHSFLGYKEDVSGCNCGKTHKGALKPGKIRTFNGQQLTCGGCSSSILKQKSVLQDERDGTWTFLIVCQCGLGIQLRATLCASEHCEQDTLHHNIWTTRMCNYCGEYTRLCDTCQLMCFNKKSCKNEFLCSTCAVLAEDTLGADIYCPDCTSPCTFCGTNYTKRLFNECSACHRNMCDDCGSHESSTDSLYCDDCFVACIHCDRVGIVHSDWKCCNEDCPQRGRPICRTCYSMEICKGCSEEICNGCINTDQYCVRCQQVTLLHDSDT